MKKSLPRWILSLSILLGIACCNLEENLSQEDQKLLIEKYIEEVAWIQSWYESVTLDTSRKFRILTSKIKKELENNNTITDTRNEIAGIARKFIKTEEASHQAPYVPFLKEKIIQFEEGNLSLIQELNFIEKTLLCEHWKLWYESPSLKKPVKYLTGDSIILYEDTEYHIPIRIEHNENNFGYTILKNSLQFKDPNQINFITPDAESSPFKVKYTIKAMHNVIFETSTFEDSLIINLIKKNG